jgi:molybdopterin/thiamine biosynthesis adenylyltransferase
MERGTDIFGRVLGWDPERLAQSKWLVVGAGALGNEVLKNLALLGVGEVWILDFDRVEPHNLSRSVLFSPSDAEENRWKAEAAALALHRMNPDLKVRFCIGDVLSDVSLGLLRRMDVVVGCVDNRLARMFLNRHAFRVGKPWVNGGIEQLEGEAGTFAPGIACYECRLTEAGRADIRARLSCADLAMRNFSAGRAVTTPLAAAVAGALQVTEGLKWLFSGESSEALGSRIRFNLHSGQFIQGSFAEPQEECGSHFPEMEIVEMPQLSARDSVAEVLAVLGKEFGGPVRIFLDFGVVTAFGDLSGTFMRHSALPRNHLPSQLTQADGSVAIPPEHFFDMLDTDFPRQDLSLFALGIPLLSVLKVKAGGESHWVELSADRDWITRSEPLLGLPSWISELGVAGRVK